MKPAVFRTRAFRSKSMDQFLEMVHSCQMRYWASDLLAKGLTPDEIRNAVRRGMMACTSSGTDYHHHFQLMYTSSSEGVSFDDCKMSRLGYQLTILNASPSNKYVASIQIKLAQSQL